MPCSVRPPNTITTPRPVFGLERQHRGLGVEPTFTGTGHSAGEPLLVGGQVGGGVPQRPDIDLSTVAVGHPRRTMRVDVDLLDERIVHVGLERAGSGEFCNDPRPDLAVGELG